jgi:hypothetical protein
MGKAGGHYNPMVVQRLIHPLRANQPPCNEVLPLVTGLICFFDIRDRDVKSPPLSVPGNEKTPLHYDRMCIIDGGM